MAIAKTNASRATLIAWTQVLVVFFVVLATLSPFTSPAMIVGAMVIQAYWIQHDHGDLAGEWRSARLTSGWIAPLLFVAYLAVRVPPAFDANATTGVIAMIIYLAAAFLAVALFTRQNDDVQDAITDAFVVAFAVAAVVHLFEVLSGFTLRRWVWATIPILQPRPGKIAIEGASLRVLVPYIANQTSAVLLALAWPIALLDVLRPGTRRRRILTWGALAVAMAAIVLSNHATSKAALICGIAIWAIATLKGDLVKPLLLVAWLGPTLLVVPTAWLGYHLDAYRLPFAFSAQHRIVLWGVTAEKTLAHPIIGIGTGRTPAYDESLHADVKVVPDTKLPIATNRHAHNVFLQTWYEDGAIGALLLLLAGLPVIGWIMRADPRARPLLAAAFVASIVGASLSYSTLAAWFLATFALTALFCRFVTDIASVRGDAAV